MRSPKYTRYAQGKGGRGGEGKKGGGHRTKKCNLCGKLGHYANKCDNATAFQVFLETKKKPKYKERKEHADEDESDYSSNMLQELPLEHSLLGLAPTEEKFHAALDSGTSSHAIKASCIPENTRVDQ